ncbi:diguanylate cyclase [Aerococcus agrisoli]|uniref:Diguanylate cyclase n=1 Tax=Aerococcus agrisoli TaxID=2487350 RepID=A0A3N4GE49_9LACT|nr:diguanylate cyclase [Aerococcus agrisoli]RPA60992.1 diguanylate cyclase [Aerococcus agrisoli]
MANITIFGKGNMGTAIGGLFEEAGNQVTYIGSQDDKKELGDIVVLAVMYPVVDSILEKYEGEFAGKVIVDITNPVNFETFDGLVVPADSSAAQVIQDKVADAKVIKAFNTTFGGTLSSKKVADTVPTTVLVAGEAEAKETFKAAFDGAGIDVIDAGELKRARELEAFGFLQITLAAAEKISWGGGFGILK